MERVQFLHAVVTLSLWDLLAYLVNETLTSVTVTDGISQQGPLPYVTHSV